jgi:hypothetical protein
LHEFKTDDDFGKDPTPENSLFLPDCVVGAVSGDKFAVKGKDVSKGKLGMNISTSHEYQFKAHTAHDAAKWYEIIKQCAGQVTNEIPESVPTSPVTKQGSGDSSLDAAMVGSSSAAAAEKQHQPGQIQTQGITGQQNVTSPTEATPVSAYPEKAAMPAQAEGIAAHDAAAPAAHTSAPTSATEKPALG